MKICQNAKICNVKDCRHKHIHEEMSSCDYPCERDDANIYNYNYNILCIDYKEQPFITKEEMEL